MSDADERGRAVQEAFVLPLLFWTVALLGGVRLDGPSSAVRFLPPPLFSLVLGSLLAVLLVRSGAFDPASLVAAGRTLVARLSGIALIAAVFMASVQVVSALVPDRGFWNLLFNLFLAVLLTNTLAAEPDRSRLRRSLAITFGWLFILKHVVLASLFDPQAGWGRRVVGLLLDGVTPGAAEATGPPAVGYIAFGTVAAYLIGLLFLPGRPPAPEDKGKISGS